MNTKKCNDCGIEYPKTNEFFTYQNKKKGYFRPYCKDCSRTRGRNRYIENRAAIRTQQAKYREENREKVLEQKQKYRLNNKEKIKEYRSSPEAKKRRNDRRNKRRKEEPSFRLQYNISNIVRMYLHLGDGGKSSGTWSALPYTPQELREHLESQFEDWMSWENYGNGEGKWNIDHITPQSKLLYDSLEHPNFLKCWALDNLQPICYFENIKKGNRNIK